MGLKERTSLPMPDELGHDFEDDHHILTFRPKIAFIQPPTQELDGGDDINFPVDTSDDSIDAMRQQARELRNGYEKLHKLAEITQGRIDQRIAADGGFEMHLDPQVDAHVIAAIKRRYPDKTDPNKITVEDYKRCLSNIANSVTLPGIDPEAVRAAKSDPYRTDFGGYGNKPGDNRVERQTSVQGIQPLDINKFQANAIIKLFEMLKDMITDLIKSVVGIP
jgi:hypothetical protein